MQLSRDDLSRNSTMGVPSAITNPKQHLKANVATSVENFFRNFPFLQKIPIAFSLCREYKKISIMSGVQNLCSYTPEHAAQQTKNAKSKGTPNNFH